MSASTKWWYCGICGFANHPRAPQGDELRNEKCEQCGASVDEKDALDFNPKGV